MAKIEFENKQALNENANIPDINKVKDSDLNEIKNVVNQTILNNLFGVYFDSWQSSETYSIGDIVIYDAILYENLTGTNTETTPDQDSTNWQVINILLNTKVNPKLIDKSEFIKNSNSNSNDETYSCNYNNIQNTWVDIDTSSWTITGTKRYAKYLPATKEVWIGLYISSGVFNASDIINNIPEKYRPTTTISIQNAGMGSWSSSIDINSNFARVDTEVGSTGYIRVFFPANTTMYQMGVNIRYIAQ